MNTFALEIWDDEGQKCTFYSVRSDDATLSETDKFFDKYDKDEAFSEATSELLSFILHAIGDEHGAKEIFFNRYENEVSGLPPQGKVWVEEVSYHFQDFPLRLYAIKITEKIVILFNGGVKDGATNQTSSLYGKWLEACSFAKRIIQAMQEKDIFVDGENRRLVWHDNTNEIIL